MVGMASAPAHRLVGGLLVAGTGTDGMSLLWICWERLSAAMNVPFPFGGQTIPFGICFPFLLATGCLPFWGPPTRKPPPWRRTRFRQVGRCVPDRQKYRDKKEPETKSHLNQHFQMGMDGHKHKRNTNVLVIGGSGAGKSRSYAIPNALNCGNCSLVICDPKSEILRKTGGALKANGYEVRVFDLLNPDASFCYNPLLMCGTIRTCSG